MNNIYETYVIKNGDTLYNIGKQNNINPELLALINGLNLDDYIYENQTILVPKSNYSYYLTKNGDKLEDILKLFNVNYNDFTKYNNSILLEDGQLFAYKR